MRPQMYLFTPVGHNLSSDGKRAETAPIQHITFSYKSLTRNGEIAKIFDKHGLLASLDEESLFTNAPVFTTIDIILDNRDFFTLSNNVAKQFTSLPPIPAIRLPGLSSGEAP